jgi:catechol 2,3-dioxygenase-like lactoylglutathione lyase family enzyme
MERLHQVAVAVPDIGKALDWYRANFDVEVSYVDESWALLQFDNIAVPLDLPDQHPPHLAVERKNAKSFDALTPHRDGTASVYIKDPWSR